MSIEGFLKSFRREEKTAANSNLFSVYTGATSPMMGEKEFLMAYRAWVYACVSVIAEGVSSTPIKLQQVTGADEWKDITQNPAIQLLKNVNPFWSSSDLMYATAAYLKLHGNSFWYLPRTVGKKPAEIWPLDPSRTFVVADPEKYISGYVFQNVKGENIPLAVEEVIHFKKFNPQNPYRGMGTVEAAALAIDTDDYASKWQRNFFNNSAMPSGLLTTTGTLNTDQYDRIKENWNSKFRGVSNAHKMALLEGGLTFQSISPTSKEMEFAQSRKDLRDEILATFRIPKSSLGITEDVNRAAAEASEYYLNKHVINPELHFICSTLNEFYLEKFGLDQNKFRLTFDDPTPQNHELQMQVRASAIQNYYMTPNEARAEIGLPPLEGGDNLFIPSLVVPMATALEADPAEESEDEEVSDEVDEEKKTISVKKKSKFTKTDTGFNKDTYINNQTAILQVAVKGTFLTLEKMLLDNLKKRKSIKRKLDKAEKNVLERLKDATQPTNELVRILFSNYNDWIGILHNATQDGINNIYQTSGKEALAIVGIDTAFNVDNPDAMDYMNNHVLEMATQVSDTIKEDMSLQLMQGLEAGTSDDIVAGVISNFFETEGDWRSLRIARTETIDAYTHGALEAYKQSDVVAGTYWSPDANACPICEGNVADGTVALGESFSSGDDGPPAHPNCLTGDTLVSAEGITKAYKRWFDGEIITFTVGGESITITPNHPVLTDKGWVAAGLLQVGDSVYQRLGWKDIVDNPDNDNTVTAIEQVFSSLQMSSEVSSVDVPLTTKDFHGDGIVNTEVNIVFVNSLLKDNIFSKIFKNSLNHSFLSTHLDRVKLSSRSTLDEFANRPFHTFYSKMSSLTSLLSNLLSRSFCLHHPSSTICSHGKVKPLEGISDSNTVAADTLSNITGRFTGKITLVKINSIGRSQFTGHVYNLETKDNYYFANSIITHNCECDVIPVLKSEDNVEE